MSVPLLVIKVHIFRIISLSIVRKQKKYYRITDIRKTRWHYTRTRTPKPGYLNLSNIFLLALGMEIMKYTLENIFYLHVFV
jgi:hypothetical protein